MVIGLVKARPFKPFPPDIGTIAETLITEISLSRLRERTRHSAAFASISQFDLKR
jgi:hypothetical protein